MTSNEKKIKEIMIAEKRNAQNKWRRKHKERVREYNETYWRKKAEKILSESQK